MSQQMQAPVQITDNGLYAIRGKTIIDILGSLKATIQCAFNPTVEAVENMLAQVQVLNISNAKPTSSNEEPSMAQPSKSAPVVPSAPGYLEMVEGGSPQ